MAPEIIKNRGYDNSWDIFSLGVVLFELLYLENYTKYINLKTPTFQPFEKRTGMNDELYEILIKMLDMSKLF